MDEVRVHLGANSYTIHIGSNLLAQTGALLSAAGLTGRVLVVSDQHVSELYGNKVLASLQAAGFSPELYAVKPGEEAKSLVVADAIFSKAIELGLDRKSPIIALGGGVVGDLTGFIAATYLRGVPFIQIPTTLLSQVDSSVGGKVAVNHRLGKNLIGAFYQPKFVIIDTDCLASLPERELATGLAEVIKYGIIADKEFFAYLEANIEDILAKDVTALTKIIKRSCEIKAYVVERDERESSLRMILNFGHTIAHAIEGTAGYGVYNHGEAVGVGMHGAMLLSRMAGLVTDDDVLRVTRLIQAFKLPLTAVDCAVDALLPYLVRDKKAVAGKINWVLATGIGQTQISQDVPHAQVQEVLSILTTTL